MKAYYLSVFLVILFCQSSFIKAEDTETAETARNDGFGDDDIKISKRSGSGSQDFFYHLKHNIAGTFSKSSASLSAGSSPHASKGSSHGDGYKHGNAIDPWNFKKSFFGTIKQAVKAITGGVTAIKGQLIKGSGVVISASGKIVAASGDKISDVGKAKVNAAQFHLEHPSYGHAESAHPLHKLSSLSSLSSGHSGGGKEVIHSKPPPVVHHTETITTYEIPVDHVNSGPPSHALHYGQISHHGRPSDAYAGSIPPHISAAHELPYEYHRHTFEGDNNYYYTQ